MPFTIGKCKLFRIKHITFLEGETFLRNKHEIAFLEIKCTFFGRKENTINLSLSRCNRVAAMCDCYIQLLLLQADTQPYIVLSCYSNYNSFYLLSLLLFVFFLSLPLFTSLPPLPTLHSSVEFFFYQKVNVRLSGWLFGFVWNCFD